MKNIFKGFYNPSDEDIESAWKDDNTLFVFDTNTFLNLYSYADQTRYDFFSILEKIKEKIWIPYQVAIEYQKRRLSVVRDEKAVFSKIEDYLKKVDSVFEKDFGQLALNRRFPPLHKNTEKLHSDIKKLIANYKKSAAHWDKKQPCVKGHDSIRDEIDKYFDGKLGDAPLSQDWLDKLYSEGEERYKKKVPPGYKDDKKKGGTDNIFVYAGLEYMRQYGDLILWKQIIEKAKSEHIDSVIFVTDDAKEDWWYIIDSRGDKKVGPRAELREEICREASVNIFTILNTSDFLSGGKKLLEVDVSDESVSDASTIFNTKISGNEKYRGIIDAIIARQNAFVDSSSNAKLLSSAEKYMNEGKLSGDSVKKMRVLDKLRPSELEKYMSVQEELSKLSMRNSSSVFDHLRQVLLEREIKNIVVSDDSDDDDSK